MENENNSSWAGWIIGIIIVISLFLLMGDLGKYEGKTAEKWFNDYDYQVTKNEELRDALEEANNNIEEANTMIENAKGYAWESYEEMGDALDYLNTVDTISEP